MESKARNRNKKNPCRFAFGALAVWGGLEVLTYVAAWLIADVFGGISFSITNASSIGIIGGADGPTSVLVTAAAGPAWELRLWILMTAVGILGLRYLNRKK